MTLITEKRIATAGGRAPDIPTTTPRSGSETHMEKSIPVSNTTNDYHIKIVGVSRRMHTETYSRQRIDAFLTDLFDSDANELGLEDAPLQFSRQAFNEGSNLSLNILQVEFKLTDAARRADITIDWAAERFCQLMFNPEANRVIQTLTPNGLLGVTALSGPFRQYWMQTFLGDFMKNGLTLLRRIDQDFRDYLPEWALALGFAVVAGLNVQVFAGVVARSFDPLVVFGTIGVNIGCSILRNYMRINWGRAPEQTQTWIQYHGDLVRSMETVSERFGEAMSPTTVGMNTPQSHSALCDALYEATSIASRMFTTNQEVFNAFLRLRNEAAISASSAGLATLVALTHFGSAFTVVTTSQAVPLASWCLADAAAFLTGAGAPIVYSTALSVAWPAAIIAAGFTAFFGTKGYRSIRETRDLNRQLEYHTRINAVIARAWGLANDTSTFLRWIHLTDASDPGSVDFIDDNARSSWGSFIQSVREATGGTATAVDLGPQAVLAYLSEQASSWNGLREQLTQGD